MSVNSSRNSVRLCAAVLSFILVWMSGGAMLKHTDCCDDTFVLNTSPYHAATPSPASGPDLCAACAWTDAVNIYLPAPIVLPRETAYAFDRWSAPAASSGFLPLRSILTRGPPSLS